MSQVKPLYPNRALEASEKKLDLTAAANKAAAETVAKEANSRKRKPYYHHGDELQAKISRHAAEHGNKSAVVKFSKELECDVCEP